MPQCGAAGAALMRPRIATRRLFDMPPHSPRVDDMLWLPSLLIGILLMIVGATEGVPYTSIHVRGESLQLAVGLIGLVLALVGIYIGFGIGKKKK
jgi:hypothetical protein